MFCWQNLGFYDGENPVVDIVCVNLARDVLFSNLILRRSDMFMNDS